MSIKLYEAVEALGTTEEWLDEAGGELTPEVEALLDGAQMAFAEKVERVALKVKALESEAEAISAEAARLTARAKARTTAAKSLKAYLQRCLEVAGETKVNGLLCTVALQTNPPAVTVPAWTDEELRELFEAGAPGVELVPERFVVNKKDLLAAYHRSEDAVPTGVTVTRSTSLRMR